MRHTTFRMYLGAAVIVTMTLLSLGNYLVEGAQWLAFFKIRPGLKDREDRNHRPIPPRSAWVLGASHLPPQVVALDASRCLLYGSAWYLLLRRTPDVPGFSVSGSMGKRDVENSEIPEDFVCSEEYFRPSAVSPRPAGLRGPSARLQFALRLTSNGTGARGAKPRLLKVVQPDALTCELHAEGAGGPHAALRMTLSRRSSDDRMLTLTVSVTASVADDATADSPLPLPLQLQLQALRQPGKQESFWCEAEARRLDADVFEALAQASAVKQ